MLSPGGDVTVASGTLAPASIALLEGAARDDRYHVDPFEASIACADDGIPDGYRALGPAVTFGPTYTRLSREIPLTIPMQQLLLPPGASRRRGPTRDYPPRAKPLRRLRPLGARPAQSRCNPDRPFEPSTAPMFAFANRRVAGGEIRDLKFRPAVMV